MLYKSLIASFILLLSMQANAVIIHTNANGQLIGASEVNVNAVFYNVEFVDGTCPDLFNGCNDINNFVFQSFDNAEAASQALLD